MASLSHLLFLYKTAIRSYNYEYNALSRLKNANYGENGTINNRFTTAYSYDKMGNIQTLLRYGKKDVGDSPSSYDIVDNLSMKYTGNQLINVHDTGVNVPMEVSYDFKDYSKAVTNIEYTYNQNGAMDKDLNRGITSIRYNSLNLPVAMEIASPHIKGRIKYLYSAGGVKLRTVHETDPTTLSAPMAAATAYSVGETKVKVTDYIANKIYEDQALKRILVDGGYIENNLYHFYITDHLGNNRVTATSTGTITQQNHYYPFGMTFAENSSNESQPYKYNGKEFDSELGVNQYDYAARYYEPATGRFTTIDPHAENYYGWSPYVYCANNPIRITDPTGMDWGVIINHENKTITITANFTTNPSVGNKGNETLHAAASNWNAQSGKFNYVIGQGNDAVTYSVDFFVTTSRNTPDMPQNEMQVVPDASRIFRTTHNSDGTITTAEGVSDGQKFAVKQSREGDKKTVAHEMGHNLGITDSTGGLMQGNLNSSNELTSTSVGQILHRSGVQNTSSSNGNTNATLISTETKGTAPQNFQGGSLLINKEWKKKNF